MEWLFLPWLEWCFSESVGVSLFWIMTWPDYKKKYCNAKRKIIFSHFFVIYFPSTWSISDFCIFSSESIVENMWKNRKKVTRNIYKIHSVNFSLCQHVCFSFDKRKKWTTFIMYSELIIFRDSTPWTCPLWGSERNLSLSGEKTYNCRCDTLTRWTCWYDGMWIERWWCIHRIRSWSRKSRSCKTASWLALSHGTGTLYPFQFFSSLRWAREARNN